MRLQQGVALTGRNDTSRHEVLQTTTDDRPRRQTPESITSLVHLHYV